MFKLHKAFALTLLYSEIGSIFNDNHKLRVCAIIFKHIHYLLN